MKTLQSIFLSRFRLRNVSYSRGIRLMFVLLFICFYTGSQAQFTQVSLQASGLTCSMCSRAVNKALEGVSFVKKVDVNIQKQEYNLSFKEGSSIDFDVLRKAVEDAGFSVANMKVKAMVDKVVVEKDSHVKIGNQYFHFLNAKDKTLNGNISFDIVDKQFVSAKQFKKYSGLSKMECVQTGKAAKCCASDHVADETRIYHAII